MHIRTTPQHKTHPRLKYNIIAHKNACIRQTTYPPFWSSVFTTPLAFIPTHLVNIHIEKCDRGLPTPLPLVSRKVQPHLERTCGEQIFEKRGIRGGVQLKKLFFVISTRWFCFSASSPHSGILVGVCWFDIDPVNFGDLVGVFFHFIDAFEVGSAV